MGDHAWVAARWALAGCVASAAILASCGGSDDFGFGGSSPDDAGTEGAAGGSGGQAGAAGKGGAAGSDAAAGKGGAAGAGAAAGKGGGGQGGGGQGGSVEGGAGEGGGGQGGAGQGGTSGSSGQGGAGQGGAGQGGTSGSSGQGGAGQGGAGQGGSAGSDAGVKCTGDPDCAIMKVGPCEKATCDAGTCKAVPIADGTPCDDQDVCTTASSCSSGVCKGTAFQTCNDSNPCTDDSCHPVTGCIFQNNTKPCNDGNACTQDVCSGGQCVGTPIVCNDNNPCTDDGCNTQTGCVYVNNASPCNDGSVCTQNDVCSGGVCKGVAVPCNDGNPCTNDTCDPVTGCKFTANDAPCNDGDACTTGDKCSGGACKGGPQLACNDGNPCTDDGCNPAIGCVFINNTAPCNDGSACTSNDTCSAGSCKGTQVVCNDYNGCTTDGCNPATGCQYVLNPNICPPATLTFKDPLNCGPVSDWSFSPLMSGVGWAIDATPSPPGYFSPACSLNYNDGTKYPGTTKGVATLNRLIDASAVTGVLTLQFQSFHGVETSFDNYDLRIVELSTDGFNTLAWTKTLPNTGAGAFPNAWSLQSFDISALKGKKFQLRFRFDSVDALYNDGPGWFVDDVQVFSTP